MDASKIGGKFLPVLIMQRSQSSFDFDDFAVKEKVFKRRYWHCKKIPLI